MLAVMSKSQLLLVVLCIFFISDCVSISFSNEESCHTPDQRLGECLQIKNCPSLMNFLQQKPLSAENINYLRQYQCGFEGSEPKVCCTFNSVNEVEWETQSSSSPQPSLSGSVSNVLPNTEICGLHQYSVRRGSVPAEIKEFPWAALLEYETPTGRDFHCGGALISSKYVLTAAHCVERMPESWQLVSVRLGEYNLDTDIDCHNKTYQFGVECADSPLDIPITEQIVHEEYSPDSYSQFNDIALLRLSKGVSFTDFIRPICVPNSSELLTNRKTGTKTTVAGWGLLSETRSHSKIKLKTMVDLKSNNECSLAYNEIHVFLNDQLCTEEQMSCTIDSGGPLMIHKATPTGFNWYIIGVHSFGPTPCGNNNWPDVYTKVTNYLHWISKNLKP